MKRGSLVLRTAMMMDAEFAVPRQFFTQCRNLLKAERKEGRKEGKKEVAETVQETGLPRLLHCSQNRRPTHYVKNEILLELNL